MKRNRLLGTDLDVSRLGFGCSTIASLTTRHTPSEVQSTLLAAVDQGIDFFDTADVYGQGDSERMIGRLLTGRRDKVVVCTKVGMRLSQSQQAIRLVKPVLRPLLRRWRAGHARSADLRRASERQCFDPEYLRQRVEASLRRLRIERIDLLLLHSPPIDIVEQRDVLAMLQSLRAGGKVRWFGVSVAQTSHALQWARWSGVSCLQLPLTPSPHPSTATLDLPDDARAVLTALQAKGIGVIAREVLGGGALALQPQVRSQALGAVLAAPGVGVALLGMGSRAHLDANLMALAAADRDLQGATT